MLFGLRFVLRVVAGPVLVGGGLTVAVAMLLEVLVRA
jgi:hypothetical protein